MLMLIDTREPPDDGNGHSPEPWPIVALGWLFPWPAIIVWLCAASCFLDGWFGVLAIYLAIGLAAWRGLRTLPSSGLSDNRQ
jgi:hypothetical protein